MDLLWIVLFIAGFIAGGMATRVFHLTGSPLG